MDLLNTAKMLSRWIATITGMDYAEPPTLYMSTYDELDKQYCGKLNCGIGGLFDGDIYIGSTDKVFRSDDPDMVSILVHELVHYYQDIQARRPVPGFETKGIHARRLLVSNEVEAYSLQNLYRVMHKLSPNMISEVLEWEVRNRSGKADNYKEWINGR